MQIYSHHFVIRILKAYIQLTQPLNPDATLIETVSEINDETYMQVVLVLIWGTGGMYNKIKAAHMATNSVYQWLSPQVK